MALVTCNQLTQALADLLAQLNNETMWVQGGRLYLQQGDGRTINADMVPGLLPLLETMNVCNVWMQGEDMHTQDRKYTSTDVLATCNGLYRVWEQLSNRIDNLPVDRFVSGMHSYNPATKVLTLIMSDDTVVDIPLSDLIGDILDSIQLQLRDCNGDPLEQDAQVPTCAQMNAALVTLETTINQALTYGMDAIVAALDGYQLKLRDADGNDLPGGTQVYSTVQTNSAINAAVTAAVTNLQARLRDCNNALIPLDTAIPTCAQMNIAIGNALAAVPAEVHVVSGAYNATTDMLVLTMNTGPAVNIPLTALVNDAVASAVAAVPAEVHVVSGAYSAGTDTLTLVMNDATTVGIVLTTLLNDAVAATQTAMPYATLAEVLTGTEAAKVVNPQVLHNRLDIAVVGLGAAASRPNPTAHNGVAVGANAGGSNTVPNFDTVVGYNALRNYDGAVMTVPQGANTIFGTEALLNYTNADTPTLDGSMTAIGFQAGLRVVGGERAVLLGGAGPGLSNPNTTLIDTVHIGAGAGRYGAAGVTPSVTTIGDVCIGRFAGQRQLGTSDASDSAVYIGFNAGQAAYAQRANTDNVFIGAGAGSISLGGASVAIGNGAYQGGLGYEVTAVGKMSAKNNVSSHCTYLGAQTRGDSTAVDVVTVDTTFAIARDQLGEYIDLPSGSTIDGWPYVVRFFTAPAAGGNPMAGTYTGVAENDRIYLPRRNDNDAPPGSVPYDPVGIQSVQLSRLSFYDNSTAVGYDALITASDTVQLGNAATQAVRSQGTFYAAGVALTSDARLKSEVEELDLTRARAFVKALRFVEYTKHANYIAKHSQLTQRLALAEADGDAKDIAKRSADLAAFNEVEAKGAGRKEAGLIAQEVQTVAQLHGFGYVVFTDGDGVLSLDYNSIQAIINAVVIDALEL